MIRRESVLRVPRHPMGAEAIPKGWGINGGIIGAFPANLRGPRHVFMVLWKWLGW
jgi:hypothetical protein